jgi:heme/copper-type cytochrome/quinol oxidase subunit 4
VLPAHPAESSPRIARAIAAGAGAAGLSLLALILSMVAYSLALKEIDPEFSPTAQARAIFVFAVIVMSFVALLCFLAWYFSERMRGPKPIAVFVAFMIVGFVAYPIAWQASWINDCRIGVPFPLDFVNGCD